MKTFIKKSLLAFMFIVSVLISVSNLNFTLAQNNPYNRPLEITISSGSLWSVTTPDLVWDKTWAELFNEQIIQVITYIINVFIVIWIAIAFVWWYKIMTSSKEESVKDWIRLVVFWIIWVIIMVSARFIADRLVGDNWVISREFVQADSNPNWINIASNLYEIVLYPFIKVALYLVIWILFFMMLSKVVKFVTATDDSTKKKALWVILRTVIWIFIILWSKQLVEVVMWRQEIVLNTEASHISEMWNDILKFENIQLISQIINRVMGLTTFVILVLIIVQWYKMFAKPDDPKNRESLKKTLLYIIIWVLVIGVSYVLSNVLVVNRL